MPIIPKKLTILIRTPLQGFTKLVYRPFMSDPKTHAQSVLFDPLIPLSSSAITSPQQLFHSNEFFSVLDNSVSSVFGIPLPQTMDIVDATQRGNVDHNIQITLDQLFKSGNVLTIHNQPFTVSNYQWNQGDWFIDYPNFEQTYMQIYNTNPLIESKIQKQKERQLIAIAKKTNNLTNDTNDTNDIDETNDTNEKQRKEIIKIKNNIIQPSSNPLPDLNPLPEPFSFSFNESEEKKELPIPVPPITVPPVTIPPVTVPPITVPPITVPSVTVPPTNVPPVNVPPVNVPPVTVPPVNVPPVNVPPVNVPPAVKVPPPEAVPEAKVPPPEAVPEAKVPPPEATVPPVTVPPVTVPPPEAKVPPPEATVPPPEAKEPPEDDFLDANEEDEFLDAPAVAPGVQQQILNPKNENEELSAELKHQYLILYDLFIVRKVISDATFTNALNNLRYGLLTEVKPQYNPLILFPNEQPLILYQHKQNKDHVIEVIRVIENNGNYTLWEYTRNLNGAYIRHDASDWTNLHIGYTTAEDAIDKFIQFVPLDINKTYNIDESPNWEINEKEILLGKVIPGTLLNWTQQLYLSENGTDLLNSFCGYKVYFRQDKFGYVKASYDWIGFDPVPTQLSNFVYREKVDRNINNPIIFANEGTQKGGYYIYPSTRRYYRNNNNNNNIPYNSYNRNNRFQQYNQNSRNINQHDLRYYIVIDLDIKPGKEPITLQQSLETKCDHQYEKVKKSWSKMFGAKYAPNQTHSKKDKKKEKKQTMTKSGKQKKNKTMKRRFH